MQFNSARWVFHYFIFCCKVLCLSVLASKAMSQTVIHDDKQLLSQVRSFLGHSSFEQAFNCEDQAQIKAFVISCSDYQVGPERASATCQEVSDPDGMLVHRKVAQCNADQVSLILDATGDTTTITKENFETANANAGELFLQNLAEFTGYSGAELTITSVEPAKFILRRSTPQEYEVDAITLKGSFGEPNKPQFPVIITFIKDGPGVAQVARFRMDEKTWFLMDDFSKGQK